MIGHHHADEVADMAHLQAHVALATHRADERAVVVFGPGRRFLGKGLQAARRDDR